MSYLVSSILVLAVGPLLHRLLGARRPMLELLDGFNFVAIAGLILLGVLPETVMQGGAWVLAFAAAGLVVPSILEQRYHRAGHESHLVSLMLGMVGLCVHSLLDGAVLVEMTGVEHLVAAGGAHVHHEAHLPFAIILHRVPVGLTVWLLLRPRYGLRLACGVLGLVAINTVLGYVFGTQALARLSTHWMVCFQALVAGSLMHVVVHRPRERDECACGGATAPGGLHAGTGGLLGLVLLAGLLGGSALVRGSAAGERIVSTFVDLTLKSAPALILGYALAGLMHAFLPGAGITWMRRGGALAQAVRGVAVGLPLPVCSCGVVPLYRTLIQRGAPVAGAMAFMVATPELGIDAVLLSIPLLGLEMTVIRVVGAGIVALLIGWIVGGLIARASARGGAATPAENGPRSGPLRERLRGAITFGFGELVDHTAPWIILGLAIAALAEPLLDARWIAWMPPPVATLLFALLGVPIYVCASGATPLVAVLLLKGVSPGAALAFLLTGPATNVTTFGVLARLHGRRAALAFSIAILAVSVGLGLVVDWALPDVAGPVRGHVTGEAATVLQIACLAALGLVYGISLLRRGPRRFIGELVLTGAAGAETEAPAAGEHGHGHDASGCGGSRRAGE